MKTLITGGRIVSEGRCFEGDILIDGEQISEIRPSVNGKSVNGKSENSKSVNGKSVNGKSVSIIDACGCYVLPGIIDDHVHFREPGLTEKGDIESESRAAAAGGVTTYFDMPNCIPPTTTPAALDEKFRLARQKSHVNYSFFYGATASNVSTFSRLDATRIPGIKLFMGSSTGDMLVDDRQALERIFRDCRLPLMVHCEDSSIISRNMAQAQAAWGDDPPVGLHAMIRSEEACLSSVAEAVRLARKYGTRLHVAHVSTAEELDVIARDESSRDERLEMRNERYDYSHGVQGNHTSHFSPLTSQLITAEVCVGYLLFSQLDHERLGTRIKVNPAIKTPVDQYLLRQALTDGRITVVATDHAPHLLAQKQGGAARAVSGMPMVQFSLVSMLELVDAGVLTIERVAELMAHNPARLFGVQRRGFLRSGYQADIVIVSPRSPWTVTPDVIQSKCGWSPLEGHEFQWRVERTLCNGHTVYAHGAVLPVMAGQPVEFRHEA